jgi:hypothetical protein
MHNEDTGLITLLSSIWLVYYSGVNTLIVALDALMLGVYTMVYNNKGMLYNTHSGGGKRSRDTKVYSG